MMSPSNEIKPVKLFVSYAHANEEYRQELAPRLKILQQRGIVEVWDDHQLLAGDKWRAEIDAQLKLADMIVLLVSDNFLASDFINSVELKQALDRHKTGDIRVIPVIVQHCLWKDSPLAEIQVLPAGGKPISTWDNANRSEPYVQIAEQIRDIAISIGERKKLKTVNERQQTNEAMMDFLKMILPVVLPQEERSHLYNLVSRRTAGYQGRSSLRKELRRLRSMQLIKMKPGKNVGDIVDGAQADIADFVELTDSGRFWMGRMIEIEGIDPEQLAAD